MISIPLNDIFLSTVRFSKCVLLAVQIVEQYCRTLKETTSAAVRILSFLNEVLHAILMKDSIDNVYRVTYKMFRIRISSNVELCWENRIYWRGQKLRSKSKKHTDDVVESQN